MDYKKAGVDIEREMKRRKKENGLQESWRRY